MTNIVASRHCRPHRRSLTDFLKSAVSLKRQRRKLADLDDRALRDIGVSRSEADAEASRYIWDAPDFWRK